jgi:diguanylate cyclase (GGDEF)-like protein
MIDDNAPTLPTVKGGGLELRNIQFLFRPVVNLRNGRCYGFQARIGGAQTDFDANADGLSLAELGRDAPPEVLWSLYAQAVDAYRACDGWSGQKLFLAVAVHAEDSLSWPALLPRYEGLSIIIEPVLRDRSAPGDFLPELLRRIRQAGMETLIDDFGVGSAGLKLLYEAKPDHVRIDRFFIDGVARDPGKRAVAQAVVGCAHNLGISVLVKGVASDADFYACRDIGFDFADGPLIKGVSGSDAVLDQTSAVVETLNADDRRRKGDDRQRIMEVMDRLKPLPVDSPKTALLDYFGGENVGGVAPVVDQRNRPLGLVRERDLKRFVYTRFGGDLLRNKDVGGKLADLVVRCPACDISTPLNQVAEAFSIHGADDGVVIVESGEYAGVLTSMALIRLMHERNLADAADQNPLTRLPGNMAISRHIETALADRAQAQFFIYFDFNNFKPFNDHFGFRQGDRAILMFSEKLKAFAVAEGGFAGHIGGDDFFLAISGGEPERICSEALQLATRFRLDVESLYDAETRQAGLLIAPDRYGALREFTLLSVSVLVVEAPSGSEDVSIDTVNKVISENKLMAKLSENSIYYVKIHNQNHDQG